VQYWITEKSTEQIRTFGLRYNEFFLNDIFFQVIAPAIVRQIDQIFLKDLQTRLLKDKKVC